MMQCLDLQQLVAKLARRDRILCSLSKVKRCTNRSRWEFYSTIDIQDDNGLIPYPTDNSVMVQRYLEGRLSLVPVT